MLDVTTRTPKNMCPHCGSLVDAATGDRTPEAGDFTICLYCAGINRFNDNLLLVKSNLQEVPQYLRLLVKQFQEASQKISRSKNN